MTDEELMEEAFAARPQTDAEKQFVEDARAIIPSDLTDLEVAYLVRAILNFLDRKAD